MNLKHRYNNRHHFQLKGYAYKISSITPLTPKPHFENDPERIRIEKDISLFTEKIHRFNHFQMYHISICLLLTAQPYAYSAAE